jgi:hypothetical protein
MAIQSQVELGLVNSNSEDNYRATELLYGKQLVKTYLIFALLRA